MFTIVADDTSVNAGLESELEQSRSLLKQQSTFVSKMVCNIAILYLTFKSMLACTAYLRVCMSEGKRASLISASSLMYACFY